MQILVAGSDSQQVAGLRDTLAQWGHGVVRASDDDEVRRIVAGEGEAQLAILDSQMARLAGPRASRDGGSSVGPHVIVLVDASDREEPPDLGLAGADDFLECPFSLPELRARLSVGERMLAARQELVARTNRLDQERAERKKAEDALGEVLGRVEVAKREWESTIDALPQFVCLLDEAGCALRSNLTTEVWGLGSVKEVKGRALHALLHGDCDAPDCYLAVLWASAKATLAASLPARFEVDDERLKRHLNIHFVPIRPDASGRHERDVSFAAVVITDISEQKRAMKAILQRDRLLAGAALAGSYLVAEADLNTSINQALRVLGSAADVDRAYVFENHDDARTGEHLMSLRFEWAQPSVEPQIDNPDLKGLSYDKAFTRWYEQLSGNKPIAGLIKDFPQSERDVLEAQSILSVLAVPIWVRRAFWGYVGFEDCREEREWTDSERDILIAAANTVGNAIERKRAEEALRESEEKFRCISVAANDAIVMVDDSAKIVYWNQAAQRIFGYSNPEALGRDIHSLLAPSCHREAARRGFEFFQSSGQGPIVGRTFETMGMRKDRVEVPIELSISAVELHDRWHAIGLVRDISERKHAEEALARAHDREIEIGSKIQRTLLVGTPPTDVPGLEIAVLSVPSQRIDGDFCDFHRNSERCLDIIVGDVMGKGVPAALLGAGTKSHFLRSISYLMARSGAKLAQPAEIVQHVHAGVVGELIGLESFVTLCYARIDLQRRRIDFVDCGHTKTIHYHSSTGTCTTLEGPNVPIGFAERETYEQMSAPIEDNDLLLFYSDGVTEVQDSAGDLFGEDRLAESVRKNSHHDPYKLIGEVRSAVVKFSHAGGFTDDLTCVAVRIHLEEEKPLAHAAIGVASELTELRRVRRFVREFCEEHVRPGLKEEWLTELELAANEAAANIMKHAYAGRSDESIDVVIEAYPSEIVLRLEHWGEPFDPAHAPPPCFDGSQDSGFGLHIISTSVDDVTYSQDDDGKQTIRLVKNR